MAFSPGRNIGRVSIRVLPDTTDFNKQLKKQLEDFARGFKGEVAVNKVKLDREAIRRDMQQQLHLVNLEAHDFKASVTIDRARLAKVALRKSIQEQFDKFENIAVKITAQIANADRFQAEVKRMVEDASDNELNIYANAQTMAAAAQFRYTARDRVVQFIAHANEAALVRTATALAALSGARLAGSFAEDIIDFARDLDKNLPSLLGWTTAITSGFAAVAAAIAGVVGVGQGLFSITPALLVIPGLAINAIGSLTALIVAWKNASTELAPLADGMREIGDIINTTYWDRARQPILNLVNGLLPQMRNAFRDLSEGVGDFTARFADAFANELGGGQFEAIFKNIAEGWRVLAEGADGFAGAIVSLSKIAAKYTPRLAAWFVRQADAFDGWLKDIATDGRLDAWMETAIDSMYDLWDATTGLAGVFEGIWRAADAAGSEGLAGFARLMQNWEATVKSADFQRGLEAVFRGSYAAMDAFGEGLKAIGRLVSDLDGAFEGFIAASGQFLGGFVEAAADALNSVSVEIGLTEFSSGLLTALERIKPSLQPIADTFGNFLGLLGTVASTVLPSAVAAIANLMPAIDGIIAAVEPVLPVLGDALVNISDELGPALADFVESASPLFQTVVSELADALVDLAPAIADLVGVLADVVEALGGWAEGLEENNEDFFGSLPLNMGWQYSLEKQFRDLDLGLNLKAVWNQWDAEASGQQFATEITAAYETVLEEKGPAAAQKFIDGLEGLALPPEVKQALIDSLPSAAEFQTRGRDGGGGFSRFLAMGMNESLPEIDAPVGSLKARLSTGTAGAGDWLRGRGGETIGGFRGGAESGVPNVGNLFGGLGGVLFGRMGGASSWLNGRGGETVGGFRRGAEGGVGGVHGVFDNLRNRVSGTFPNAGGMLWGAGSSIMSGLLNGLRSAWNNVKTFIGGIAPWIRANKGPEAYDRQLLVDPGMWIMGGLERGLERGFGRVKSRVSVMASEIRDEFDGRLAGDISVGLSASADAARAVAATAAVKQKGEQYATDRETPAGGVNVTFVNPITRDLEQEAWEAAQIIGGVNV